MKRIFVSFVAALFLVTVAGSVFASQGTKAEAKAMVEKAQAYIKANSKEKALAEINNPMGKFVDRDLYLFAYDFKGVNLAHGGDFRLVGKNLLLMQDPDGKSVIKDLIEIARKGSGWYDYKWTNPRTKKVEGKTSYVLKIDDGLWIGCGVYK
jgi:cytochrome c